MPANAGTTWQLEPQKISNRTHPKHPKGLGKVRFFSVRDRKNKRHDKAAGAFGMKRKTAIPLRVCGKVVILQCRWPVNRAGRKIDPTSNLAEIATKNKSSYLLGAFFISFARCGFFLDMGRRSNAVSSSCFDFPYHSVVTISLNSLPSR